MAALFGQHNGSLEALAKEVEERNIHRTFPFGIFSVLFFDVLRLVDLKKSTFDVRGRLFNTEFDMDSLDKDMTLGISRKLSDLTEIPLLNAQLTLYPNYKMGIIVPTNNMLLPSLTFILSVPFHLKSRPKAPFSEASPFLKKEGTVYIPVGEASERIFLCL